MPTDPPRDDPNVDAPSRWDGEKRGRRRDDEGWDRERNDEGWDRERNDEERDSGAGSDRFRFARAPRSDAPSVEGGADRSDLRVLRDAFSITWRHLYRHGAELVVVSLCWFVASLPLITIGPATVWAYATIGGLVEDLRFEPRRAAGTARAGFLGATLFGVVPLLFAAGTVVFFLELARTGSTGAHVLAVGSAYALAFAGLVLIPTFVALADGDWPGAALKRGYLWTANHPTLALTTGLVTLGGLVLTAALTVGFVLLFAGVAFTFHYAVVSVDL